MDSKVIERTKGEIKDLCNVDEGLNDWEVDFVENMSHQEVTTMTPKQLSKIKELWDRHCG